MQLSQLLFVETVLTALGHNRTRVEEVVLTAAKVSRHNFTRVTDVSDPIFIDSAESEDFETVLPNFRRFSGNR